MHQSCQARAVALAGLLLFFLVGPAMAHRVNVFAYVEGNTVHVECSYSRSNRVRLGQIEVLDAATGKVYLSGTTDENGNFAFPVPETARTAKADLTIRLKAGEGHQNDWTVKADEYLTGPPATPTSGQAAPAAPATTTSAAPATPAKTPTTAASESGKSGPAMAAMDSAALQQVVEAAVEKKIAPLRNILLAEKEQGPGMTEIFGGIGYLVGIAGLLAYARSRRGGQGS